MSQSILSTVRESAKDLHEAGAMKETTLREFDALCLPPVKEYTAVQIRRIRTRNRASQGVFAAYHQCVHGAEVGARPEKTEWPFAKAAESGGGKGAGSAGLIGQELIVAGMDRELHSLSYSFSGNSSCLSLRQTRMSAISLACLR